MEILLVEDNPSDAELALLAIRQARFAGTVTHLDDGARAFEYLHARAEAQGGEKATPRVVFMDLKLPRVDGIQLLRMMKADDRLRLIPVVMLTSSQELNDVAHCYAAGVNSYAVKPVNFDEYQALIASLVNYWTRTNLPARRAVSQPACA
jgi:two-component system response regulator